MYQVNQENIREFEKAKQELEEFNHKWNEYLKQSSFSDENLLEASFAKANEFSMKAKPDLDKLYEFIFSGNEIKFEKKENKLEKSVLGFLVKKNLFTNQLFYQTDKWLN